MPGAFKHQDQSRVPLVWQHGHSDPENVLGHAMLEARDDGIYAHGYFNKSSKAGHAKTLLEHRDISMLSIWANELVERAGRVLHGSIREVSLVLSGANPGAVIENVSIHHSDGSDDTLDDEAIIYTGLEFELTHSDVEDPEPDPEPVTEPEKEEKEAEVEPEKELEVVHAAGDTAEETVQDVYDSMSQKQKDVLHFMLAQALESNQNSGGNAQQSNLEDDSNDSDKEGSEMTRNVFEKDEKDVAPPQHVLSHADIKGIVADATKLGSLKDAVEAFAISHGINDIDVLFPDAVAIDNIPEFLKRRTEWVTKVMGGVRKSPFSRIKTLSADITVEEARAKGYITGTLKREEFFGVAKRVTTPTTIYKKQKLDRDDIIDITDFDVVAWLKTEMRLMLDEEIARAILIGDGRDVANEDKINEQNIRPIAKDHELYTVQVNVNLDDTNSSVTEIIDAVILNRKFYKGTGLPIMYTTETIIARFMLLKDTVGRRIYKSLDELATELRVSEIVAVEVMEQEPSIVAIIVNPIDYIMGATAGGQVSLFDDFDIDYNQYKYLIETRLCGALIKLKSAMVVKKTGATAVLVVPTAPTFNGTVITIPTTTGVDYKKDDGTTVTAAQTLASGVTMVINAVPKAGYYFATSEEDTWSFTNTP